jgi:putative ATP-dependent endonuclease of OLD family
MSKIRLNSIEIQNYRSFGANQVFNFPKEGYKKPVAIVGYNNSGKTNLMNAILFGIGEKYLNSNTFGMNDLHNCSNHNQIKIKTDLDASDYNVWSEYYGRNQSKSIKGTHTITTCLEDGELLSKLDNSFFGANKHYNIFYINFHNIKDEIATQKTSWGKLNSFLGRHIQKIVDGDSGMKSKRGTFESEVKSATDKVLEESILREFINSIKVNYSTNLRDNNCDIDFGLPGYEEIFLQMLFKIGLNGSNTNYIPIDHFGDGYISMFVMAVIQAIAEDNTEDKCLFLFEEPECFLHVNHQEYFYKVVLCGLAERGHQVIYTTHSDKMIDIFDTKGLIRIEFDEEKKQTEKKYNNTADFCPSTDVSVEVAGEVISLANYNSYIKSVEPNLNKIVFSRKVLLVEGPNDLMAYKFAVKKKIESFGKTKQFAETYLNFLNISILAHHGKITALLLIDLCKHLKIDYFVINDLDFTDEDLVSKLAIIETKKELEDSFTYKYEDLFEDRSPTSKGMLTTNWKLISNAGSDKIHFNTPKLENLLGYNSLDKNSIKIWNKLNSTAEFSEKFFPASLEEFLEISTLERETPVPVTDHLTYGFDEILDSIEDDDLPF